VVLVLNGFELVASVDEQEKIMLAVASGEMGRDEFAEWVVRHTHKRGG
jgi:death-on-curing protein